MLPYQKIFQRKTSLCMLFLFCIQTINVYATTADTNLLKKPVVEKISFPELKEAPGSHDSSSFVLPFSRAGNLMIIKAKADSTEGNFILDTGCPGLVLNITYFRNYQSITDPNAETEGINGAVATEQVSVHDFHFGTIQQYNVKADLANLGNIENSKGIKVLGLIGLDFLKDCELIIDYQSNLMYFHVMNKKESGSYKNQLLNDTSAYYTLPFEISDNKMIVKTTMEGKKLRFVIDCAAETNILDSRLPDKIFENLSITGRTVLTGVGNKKIEAVKGSIPHFKIGGSDINDMPVLIVNLEKTCLTQGGCIDGILGLDNLSVQKIGFNFTTLKMYIWK